MKKRIVYHIIFWVAYVLFKSYLNLGQNPVGLSVTGVLLIVAAQAIFLVVKVPMVYSLFYIIEKYLAKKWNTTVTAFAIIGLYILSVGFYLPVRLYLVLEWIYEVQGSWRESLSTVNVLYTIFVLGFTGSVAVAVKLVRYAIRQREAEQEMVQRKLETELRFLKAQINPHFFFNILSNIYALARKRSDQTADVVMKLSELFRFILYESQRKYISIKEEIHVLENYIELESTRYNEKLQVVFTKSIDNGFQPIAPLILLPFVENTFKHGASESLFHSYITIDIQLNQKQLRFTCENSKAEILSRNGSDKIGLVNIRRQLELLYPEHTLDINDTGDRFKVSLNVNLDSGKALLYG